MVTMVDEATALVLTTNVALVAPAAIVTLGGALAAPLLLESATCAPPAVCSIRPARPGLLNCAPLRGAEARLEARECGVRARPWGPSPAALSALFRRHRLRLHPPQATLRHRPP